MLFCIRLFSTLPLGPIAGPIFLCVSFFTLRCLRNALGPHTGRLHFYKKKVLTMGPARFLEFFGNAGRFWIPKIFWVLFFCISV
jgi:hypothetical protein